MLPATRWSLAIGAVLLVLATPQRAAAVFTWTTPQPIPLAATVPLKVGSGEQALAASYRFTPAGRLPPGR